MRRPSRILVCFAMTLAGCAPGGGDPAALIGTWESGTPGVRLELEDHAYRLESGTLVKWGTAQRTPFRVVFVLERTSTPAFDRYCREVVNVYDWRIEDEVLTFRAVGRPCDRQARTVLVAGAWRKVGS